MAHVLALDLDKISRLAGCTTEQLVAGLRSDDARALRGVACEGEQQVTALAGRRALPAPRVRQVLISCASRPGAMDSHELPKPLIQVGRESILRLLLRQLRLAGVTRVVLVLGFQGQKIRADVEEWAVAAALDVEFVDLGPDYAAGFARSLLEAAPRFGGAPFLLSTSDHVFDAALIHRLADRGLPAADAACALVELDVGSIPEESRAATSVRAVVDRESAHVMALGGPELPRYDAIEAGLFLCTTAVFDELHALARTRAYFTLAQALGALARAGTLAYEPTDGAPWFAVETAPQLSRALELRERTVVSPFDVVVAPALPAAWSPEQRLSFTLAVSAGDEPLDLDLASSSAGSSFGGFAVPASHSAPPPSEADEERWPLPLRRLDTSEGAVETVHGATFDDPFLLTFGQEGDLGAHEHDAYLLEYRDSAVLAVPQLTAPAPAEPRLHLPHLPHLPSDIKHVSVEASAERVDVHIQREVPLVGFALLATALLAVSTLGTATDLQGSEVSEPLKMVWRSALAVALQLPLMLLSLGDMPPARELPWLRLLGASVGYTLWLLSFNVALALTSITHAFLMNNLHSLVLVFARVVRGQPMARGEALGVLMGAAGCAVCASDATAGVTALGDLIAFAGSVAGALYLTCSKAVRPQVPVYALSVLVNAASFLLGVAYMTAWSGDPLRWDADPRVGVLGWAGGSTRMLLLQLYISGVCSTVGIGAYLGVLQFVKPVVVSMAMLSEPVLANVSGVLAGVDQVPGVVTVLGGLCVLAGTGTVAVATRSEETVVDASSAVPGPPRGRGGLDGSGGPGYGSAV